MRERQDGVGANPHALRLGSRGVALPGLTTAFDYLFTAYDVDETTELATMRYLLRAIRAKQEATSSLEVR